MYYRDSWTGPCGNAASVGERRQQLEGAWDAPPQQMAPVFFRPAIPANASPRQIVLTADSGHRNLDDPMLAGSRNSLLAERAESTSQNECTRANCCDSPQKKASGSC